MSLLYTPSVDKRVLTRSRGGRLFDGPGEEAWRPAEGNGSKGGASQNEWHY